MNNKSILNAFKHKILNEAAEMSDAQIEIAEQLADKVMSELSLDTELYYDNNDIVAIEKNKNILKKIQDASHPFEEFDEIMMDSWQSAIDETIWENVHLVYDKMQEEDELLPSWKDAPEELQDYILDKIRSDYYPYVPVGEIANRVDVNVIVTLNRNLPENIFIYEDDRIIDVASEFVDLLNILNIKKDVFMDYAISHPEADGNNKIMNQLIDELMEVSTTAGAQIVFCGRISLAEYFDLVDPENKNSYIEVARGTNFGIFDPSDGSGSVLGCETPTTIKIKKSDCGVYLDDADRYGAYGVDETYGLTGSFWDEGSFKSVN